MTACRPFARLLLALALLGPAAVAAAQTLPVVPTKIKVYLVGTFHFNASTTDVIKGTKVDMNTPDNQRQLDELVGKLQKTQADKVFVEWELNRQRLVDSTYALYRKNQFTLGNNEVYQVGYRLAKKLDRPRVYCADADGVFDYPSAQAYAKAHGQETILKEAFTAAATDSVGLLIEARTKAISAKQKPAAQYTGTSLLTQFKNMNTEAGNQGGMDSYLLGVARVGGGNQYPGADLAGEFFKRNVRICTNILRRVDVQHDKSVVLIIGQGHIAFLKSILKYSSLFEVQDVEALLNAK